MEARTLRTVFVDKPGPGEFWRRIHGAEVAATAHDLMVAARQPADGFFAIAPVVQREDLVVSIRRLLQRSCCLIVAHTSIDLGDNAQLVDHWFTNFERELFPIITNMASYLVAKQDRATGELEGIFAEALRLPESDAIDSRQTYLERLSAVNADPATRQAFKQQLVARLCMMAYQTGKIALAKQLAEYYCQGNIGGRQSDLKFLMEQNDFRAPFGEIYPGGHIFGQRAE